jgi:hypothetical protein
MVWMSGCRGAGLDRWIDGEIDGGLEVRTLSVI